MFLTYLRERVAWIVFLFSFQVWLNIILSLDVAFMDVSLLYINTMSLLAFFIFFIWRYKKETKFLKEIEGNVMDVMKMESILTSLPEGRSVFEKRLINAVKTLMQVANEELNNVNVNHLEEKDLTLSWIHEVKTPLTGMKLMIDTIQSAQIKRKLEVEWLRIHLLLDQQLHHTRLPSLEKDYLIESVNIQKVIPAEIKELKEWCMQKGIGFDIDLLEEEVVTDQKWLSFILRQLLSNAVKYSNNGGEIHIYSRRENSGHITLCIQDFGIGISLTDLPRIFEKTYTGVNGRDTTASTGMGLYLAKRAAERLGINITVVSKLHIGTTFQLLFPKQNEMTKILGR